MNDESTLDDSWRLLLTTTLDDYSLKRRYERTNGRTDNAVSRVAFATEKTANMFRTWQTYLQCIIHSKKMANMPKNINILKQYYKHAHNAAIMAKKGQTCPKNGKLAQKITNMFKTWQPCPQCGNHTKIWQTCSKNIDLLKTKHDKHSQNMPKIWPSSPKYSKNAHSIAIMPKTRPTWPQCGNHDQNMTIKTII